jgi:L-ribulose-5-phosphate 3-epimerase
MIISCGTVCYMGVPLERALEGISRAGYEYVELLSIPNWIAPEHVKPEMGEGDMRKVSKLLGEYGLSPISLSGHIDFLIKNPQDTKIAAAALEKRIELASRLGCKYVNTGAWATDRESFYDAVKGLLDSCKRHNVILGLEVGEPGLTATGRELMELLTPIESEAIGVNYDTGNVRWLVGIEPETDLPGTLSRLVHMHLKDQVGGKDKEDFPALGDGEVNFAAVFDIIRKSGFQGPFTIEIENRCESPAKRDEDVKRSYEFTKRFLP